MRTLTPLAHWELTRTDPATDTASWEPVTLPHAWNTAPGGVASGHDDRGPGWYRTRITAPGTVDGARVFLHVAAAGTVASVTCNDIGVGEHRGATRRSAAS